MIDDSEHEVNRWVEAKDYGRVWRRAMQSEPKTEEGGESWTHPRAVECRRYQYKVERDRGGATVGAVTGEGH